mmetsp:Transcript_32132/g.47332  ORF Transcript_32132/g.47332 Transcript_32132/m.47332 type:complete len:297 (+) Transcript_32132:554-1444(+)
MIKRIDAVVDILIPPVHRRLHHLPNLNHLRHQMMNQETGVAGETTDVGQIVHHHHHPTKMKLIFEENELVQRRREIRVSLSLYQSEVKRKKTQMIALNHVTNLMHQRKVATKVAILAIHQCKKRLMIRRIWTPNIMHGKDHSLRRSVTAHLVAAANLHRLMTRMIHLHHRHPHLPQKMSPTTTLLQCQCQNHYLSPNQNVAQLLKLRHNNENWRRPRNDACKRKKREQFNRVLLWQRQYQQWARVAVHHMVLMTEMSLKQGRSVGSLFQYQMIVTPWMRILPSWFLRNVMRGRYAN